MTNNYKLSILIIALIALISCESTTEYIPVGTNCKKYKYSALEVFMDAILGNSKNENENYDPDFEYKECLRNERLKIEKQSNIKEEKEFKKLKEEINKNNIK